jgi:hypothetical protein
MLNQIAFYPIFGEPLIIILGIATFISLIITACLGPVKMRLMFKIPLKRHYQMAGLTIALGLAHGLLIMLSK